MNEPQNFDVNISNPIRPPFLLPFNLREFEYEWAVKIFSSHFFSLEKQSVPEDSNHEDHRDPVVLQDQCLLKK